MGYFKNCLSKRKFSEPAITWNALASQPTTLKMSCTPEVAIQSCNTGQPVSDLYFFGSCQLIITYMSNIKFITKSSHGLCLNNVKSEHQKIVDVAYESLQLYCFASGKT